MLKTKKIIGRVFLILLLMLLIIILANGQDEEVIPGVGEEEVEIEIGGTQELIPQVTNLDVLLIDNINQSRIRLTNCVLVLAGELRICEDSFTYNNTFASGDLYKITVLVELKDTE